jgi:DnaJ homolog subfamily C member 28
MNRWESLVEKKIREAMEEGEFDNLPGKGRPLDLTENPFEDPDLRMAHRLLRNAGFAPPWIEERKEIFREFDVSRTKLQRARDLYRDAGNLRRRDAEASWERNLSEFRDQVAALNKRIQLLNLKVPGAVFQLKRIDAAKIIKAVEAAD